MAFFHRFRKKKNIKWTLLCFYGFSWIELGTALRWASEYNETGKFILRMRASVSIQSGNGAVATILTMKLFALLLFCIGVYYTVSAFISFKENTFTDKEPQEDYSICPSCMKISKTDENKKQLCKECNVQLEPVKGFFDRHPDYKDMFKKAHLDE